MSLRQRFMLPLLILAVPWLQEILDQLLFGGRWNLPMANGGPFWGVFTAPFSHAGFGHLISNSIWFLPLSWLVLVRGVRPYLLVWAGVFLTSVPVWLFWPSASHGLSGVIYGLLGYVVVIGLVERKPVPIVLSVLALTTYGGMLPALVPLFSPPGVSWIGHASGFAGGLLASRL